MASKSYGWDVRNIAKINPKMAKNQPFFDFFRFFQKLSIRFERNFLQLFYTILESYMCNGIKIVWLGCEKHSQIKPKNCQKKTVFFRFFRFSQKLSIRFERKRVRKKKTLADSFTAYAALVYRLDRSTEATTGKNKPGPAQVGARSSF